MASRSVKILLLGDGAVGKTSLVRRFVEQKFDDKYKMSIGVNVKKRVIEELDLNMMVWDIYGQKLNKKLHSSHYSGADGAIIVYDLTRYETFVNLDDWIDHVFSYVGELPVAILGNKFDLIEAYETSDEEDFNHFVHRNHLEVLDAHTRIYGEDPVFRRVMVKDFWDWANKKKDETDLKFSFYMTSAKTGENVDEAFLSLSRMLAGSDNDE